MSIKQAPPSETDMSLTLQASTRLSRAQLGGVAVGGGVIGLAALTLAGGLGPVSGVTVTCLGAAAAVVLISWAREGGRRARDRFATVLALLAFGLAVVPLIAILGYTVVKGLQRLDGTFLLHSMNNVAESDAGGGAYHAIIGTLEQVGLTTLMAVPIGLLTAIFLTEYAGYRVVSVLRTVVDVMIGIPSIVAGLFILALWILMLDQPFSGLAGAMSLVILMLPTVIRTSEEMLLLVPTSLREASYALGVPKWRTITGVVLPSALPGIVTGILLGIARVMGETAPVLLTVFGNAAINFNPFKGPQGSLPLFVFTEAQMPNDTAVARAWAGALTLVLIVMLLNLAGRLFARWKSRV